MANRSQLKRQRRFIWSADLRESARACKQAHAGDGRGCNLPMFHLDSSRLLAALGVSSGLLAALGVSSRLLAALGVSSRLLVSLGVSSRLLVSLGVSSLAALGMNSRTALSL